MKRKRYTIQELSELTGFSRRTIRYYIQEGLLEPPAGRGRGGFYYDSHLKKLSKIRQFQNQGLKLDSISQILHDPVSESLETGITNFDTRFKYSSKSIPSPAADQSIPESTAEFGKKSTSDDLAIAAASPKVPSREVWIRHTIADGISLNVRRDIDIKHRKIVDQVIRLAAAIIKKSAKGE